MFKNPVEKADRFWQTITGRTCLKVVRVVPVLVMRLEGWKDQILKVSGFSGHWGFYLGPYPRSKASGNGETESVCCFRQAF